MLVVRNDDRLVAILACETPDSETLTDGESLAEGSLAEGSLAPTELEPETTDPLRRCIATGLIAAKETLLRFVVAPDGAIVPDLDHKLPGRGLYLAPQPAAITAACTRRGFARAARRPVTVPADLAALLDRLIADRCCTMIGLARRAGFAVMGYDQVASQIKAGRVGLLLQACDAAPGGRAQLRAAAHNAARNAACHESLTATELARPFGRDHVVHVALAPGRLTERLTKRIAQLTALRLGDSRQELT